MRKNDRYDRKACRSFMPLLLTLILTAFPAVSCVWAAEKPADMDEAVWARLQDNRLEYDEIENLVEYYNPTYLQTVANIEVNLQPMREAVDELHGVIRDNNATAREAREEGDIVNQMIAEGTAKGAKTALKMFERSLGSAEGSTRPTKNMVRKQLTNGVQQLMIGYHQAAASQELCNVGVELAQAALEAVQTQQTVGMATDGDVQSARKALLSAQSQQQTLNDTLNMLRQQLCIMTGWSYTDAPEIGEIPSPDVTRIDAMNPSADITMAFGSNYDVIALRATSGKGDVNRNRKFRSLDELEAKLKTKLEALYQTVLQSRAAYDAANTALESARLTMEGNERKYQMGMLGRLEYLQAKTAYLQQKMAADNAALALTQAMEAYDWAVKGIVDLE